MIHNKKHGLSNTKNFLATSALALAIGIAIPSYAADSAQLNLKDADIKTLIDMVSRITKKTFIVDPRINGKVTIVTGRDIDENELYEVFLSVLQVHNFSAVPTGNIIKIVPSNQAKQLPVPVIETAADLKEKKPDDLITRVIRVEHVPASMLVPILRPLVPSTGQLQAYAPSNTIVISDRAANIERLIKVIKKMDRADDEQMEVVPLRYASAKALAQTIQTLNRTKSKIGLPGKAKISADSRTNSLLLGGDKSIRQEMRKIIRQLDTPKKALEVIPLRYAVAKDLAQTIKNIQSTTATAKGVVSRKPIISVDNRTNSLLLGGDSATRQQIKRIIVNLDTPKKAEEKTRVVYLRYAKATEVAKVLTGVSKTQKNTTATSKGAAGTTKADIDIQADEATNSLIITAGKAAHINLAKVIRRLDVRRAQVMVEVIIAEVSENLSKEIGVQLSVGGAHGTVPIAATGYSGSKVSLASVAQSLAKNTLPTTTAGIITGLANTVGDFQFAALMNALRGDAATNILSTPNVIAMDNEEAKFVIGKNVPFVTGSYTGTTSGSSTPSNPFQTIERKDVGLTLKIKPQINSGNSVVLDIDQEISSLASSNESASDLITNKRAIKTKVIVEDNQIIVLGGLMQDDYTTTTQKVPILGDLPVVGKLFQNNKTTKVKQNLMIFIHPVILRDVLNATGYTREKYNNIRRAQQASKVTTRGLLKQKARQFPRSLKSITTQKMTPAQIRAMRLAEWKRTHPQKGGAVRQQTHYQQKLTPAQIRAKRLAEWNRAHPKKAVVKTIHYQSARPQYKVAPAQQAEPQSAVDFANSFDK
ncbi:MAG: type II secretion system protein GspD [Aquificaceae bacterium]|nr:MAG: type II secretion system protein GspD [Aquificaceae bacterium]